MDKNESCNIILSHIWEEFIKGKRGEKMKILIDVKQIYIKMAEKKLNGTELAKQANISPNSVSQVLNGKRRGTTKVLDAICKVLDLSIKDVIIIEE